MQSKFDSWRIFVVIVGIVVSMVFVPKENWQPVIRSKHTNYGALSFVHSTGAVYLFKNSSSTSLSLPTNKIEMSITAPLTKPDGATRLPVVGSKLILPPDSYNLLGHSTPNHVLQVFEGHTPTSPATLHVLTQLESNAYTLYFIVLLAGVCLLTYVLVDFCQKRSASQVGSS